MEAAADVAIAIAIAMAMAMAVLLATCRHDEEFEETECLLEMMRC